MKRSILAGLALCLLASSAHAATQVTPIGGYSHDISGTVTLGGTYQQVEPANNDRKNCTVQNPSSATENLNVKIGTMTSPYVLAAGQAISTLNGTVTATDAISVTAATSTHPYSGTCQ
jgi:hypothetical protein